jgi:hypothetical protein
VPTLVYLDGFEHWVGSEILAFNVADHAILSGVSGVPTNIAGGRNGRGMQVACSASSVYFSRNFPGTNPTASVVSFYIKFTVLPTVDSVLFVFIPGSGTGGRLWFKQSTGKFHLAISATANGTDVGPAGITTGVWYRVDLKFTNNANPWTLNGSIDGGADVGVTLGAAAGNFESWRFGADLASTYTAQYDDFVASSTTADYPMGAHKVLPLQVNGDGTHSTGGAGFFDKTGGADIIDTTTDAWQQIDDWITGVNDGATTQILQIQLQATRYTEHTFEDTAEATIWGAVAAIASAVGSTTANNITFRIVNAAGATVVDLFSGDPSISVATHYAQKFLAANPTSTTVNGYKFRFGFSSDSTPNASVTAALLQIAVPEAGGAPANQNIALIDQTAVIFAVTINAEANLGFINQTATMFAPGLEITQPVALIDQTAVIFAVTAEVQVGLGFIDQTAIIFAPGLELTQPVGLIDQTATIFAVTVDAEVNLGFIDQTATIFAPTIDVSQQVAIGFIDQTSVVFAVTVDQDVVIGFIDQSGVVYAVSISATQDTGLIDQTGQIFAVTVETSVNPALIDQSAVMFAVTIEQETLLNFPMIDQTAVMFDLVVQQDLDVFLGFIDNTYQIMGVSGQLEGGLTSDLVWIEEWLDEGERVCLVRHHNHYPHYPERSNESDLYYEPVKD